MKTNLKIITLLIFAGLALASITPKGQTQQQVETAGQKFKSIKVLNNMPADQMGKVMNMMSASLGVDCKFCHTSNDGDYEKEGIDHKDTAREMLKMTFELNKNYFNGRPEINCNTCHKGISHPQPSFPLAPAAAPIESPKQPDVKPTVDQILANYEKALGGKANLAKVNSRWIKAKRIEPDGKTTELEIIEQKDAKLRIDTFYGPLIVSEISNGQTAWKIAGKDKIELKADEMEQIKREAQLFATADIKGIYLKMDFRFVDRIDGREVYYIQATTAANGRERLYFDKATGLLVRRAAATPTILGMHTFQVDYLDYKDFGGVKLPTTTKFAVPQIYWTRKIEEVKNNTVIDDARFKN
jgi:hypothetical protein